MTKPNKDWNEEFDNKFHSLIEKDGKCKCEDIKTFIDNLLAKRQSDLVEKLEGMKEPIDLTGTARNPQELVDNLKEWMKVEAKREGYNQALDKVIQLLK